MSASDGLKRQVLVQSLNYVSRDPEQNLERLVNLALPFAREPRHREHVHAIRESLRQDSNWRELAIRLLREVHPRVRNHLAVNLVGNAFLRGVPRQHEVARKSGCSVPVAILIDPTSACNLNCRGCWASDYSQAHHLEKELMARVFREAREMGIYFIVYSGGEPLLRQSDLLELAEEFDDMAFLAFTNGTMIDQQLVDDLIQAGNFTLALSMEGFRGTTDGRRGEGTYDQLLRAMDMLRESGAVFGCSVTYNRENTAEVGSEEFVDLLVDRGAAYLWYFTYVPVGADWDLDLMATPEQREHMYRHVRMVRATRPLLTIDFWNDGFWSGGCIAGGRRYLHINAAGEVEPCAFIHYATDNIREKSLLEVLDTPLMREYQERIPFNENLLRPCPLIDNPEQLADMVETTRAFSTQQRAQRNPWPLAHALEDYAREWGERAEVIRQGDTVVSGRK